MTGDEINPGLVGSTDWTGGVAPSGGTHSGVSTLVMDDGVEHVVAHSEAEVWAKINSAPQIPRGIPEVAFDQPGRGTTVTLDVSRIRGVVA